ncbi:hypothetical protein HF086_013503 [Spodoptera exigua]|uniref:Major facilitator superfamily (MFS) profile domain-containing protein n=1 Tax=Spodoptera exigua TaxID=7107 RepID=A0A922SBA2_SPOEX|nr:hypothetical protein HF086_013503 [Spodoptera exigua]
MEENKIEVVDQNTEPDFKGDTSVSGWGYRHQQCFILFCTLTIAYSMRSCMGVALVAMTDHHVSGNDTNVTDANNFETDGFLNALMIVPPYPAFSWNKKVQDTVISSFFWGYMLLQIPAGQIAHRFGTRYLLSGAMMINCLVSIFFPIAAFYGGWLCSAICRALQGLSQACIMPGLHTALGKWAPLHERGRMSAFVYGGQALGTVFGLPITGFLASSVMGWPGIFRFYGTVSGLLSIVLWFMAADSPAKHPKISTGERKYIEDELGTGEAAKRVAVPWGKILRHKGLYAIVISHIGQTWGQITLYSEVPAFMDKIMGVNIKANGLLTALPFLVMWFTNFFFSWMTDMLIVKNILSVTNTRKLANSLGNFPAAIGLVALAFAPKEIYVIETILIVICGFKVSSHLGFHINHIDISPNYAGTMMSISNFVSNTCASMAPLVVGFILTDVTDELLWRKIFFVAAGIYFFTNIVYLILGTAEQAEWNDPPEQKTEKVDEESVPMIGKFKNGYIENENNELYVGESSLLLIRRSIKANTVEDNNRKVLKEMTMVEKQDVVGKGSKSNFKVAYSMRACMGVSLVAMTKYGKTAANYPTFDWDKKTQDAVIASFFWGYMLLQIPGGQLAHRFGARYLLTGAMMINCVVSILLPLAAYYGGWISTAVCRVLQGLSQACIVPGLHTSLGKWAPLQERGRIAAFVYGGQALGTVFGLPMTGFISSSSLGWPGIFRFYGILSGIIGALLFWLAADTPAKHKKISEAERKYIEDELGTRDVAKKMPVPWTKILSHKGVYAIIIAHVGTTWGQLVLYSEVPAYLDKIMGVNIKANGLLTALPFLVMWFTNFFFSWMTDMLIVKNILSPTNTRKFANSLGNVPAAIGLIALAYAPKNMFVVEAILVFTCAFKISAHLGFQINHIDISPNFAGTMMSLSNFTSNIGASIAPLITGFILTDVNDVYLWRQVFFVAAGIYLVTNLIYVIFATAEKAEWNEPVGTQLDEEEGHPMMEKPKLQNS